MILLMLHKLILVAPGWIGPIMALVTGGGEAAGVILGQAGSQIAIAMSFSARSPSGVCGQPKRARQVRAGVPSMAPEPR